MNHKKLSFPPGFSCYGRERLKSEGQTVEEFVSQEKTPHISETYQTTWQKRLDVGQLVNGESVMGANIVWPCLCSYNLSVIYLTQNLVKLPQRQIWVLVHLFVCSSFQCGQTESISLHFSHLVVSWINIARTRGRVRTLVIETPVTGCRDML